MLSIDIFLMATSGLRLSWPAVQIFQKSGTRYTGHFWPVLRTWVAVGKRASCVFFNQGVFYHPPGDFYTMGCYKLPKIISKKNCYATRPLNQCPSDSSDLALSHGVRPGPVPRTLPSAAYRSRTCSRCQLPHSDHKHHENYGPDHRVLCLAPDKPHETGQ